MRIREGDPSWNFDGISLPTIFYSKTSGPQALTHRGTSLQSVMISYRIASVRALAILLKINREIFAIILYGPACH